MTPLSRVLAGAAVAASLAAVLAACGGTDSLGSSSSSSSSSSCDAQYADVVPSNVRTASNNDTQCALYIANADGLLEAARAACRQGNSSGAAATYQNYLKAADSAVASSKLLCPVSGSGSSSSGNSLSTGLYTLWVCTNSSGSVVSSSCSTSSTPPSGTGNAITGGTCTWRNGGGNYSQSACSAAQSRL